MRLFIGVPVPVEAVMRPIRHDLASMDGIRPVPDDSHHVTLRFLGELDAAQEAEAVQKVGAAIAGLPGMDACIDHVGAFKDARHARILWAGLRAPGLEGLHDRIAEATASIGDPLPSRWFVPHITLARAKAPRDARTFVERYAGQTLWEGSLDQVVLYGSRLAPDGPHYEQRRVWHLAEP